MAVSFEVVPSPGVVVVDPEARTALLCALVRRLLFTGEHALVAQYVVRLGEQADEDATEEYKAYLSLLQQALLAAQFEAAVVGRWSKASGSSAPRGPSTLKIADSRLTSTSGRLFDLT